MITEKNLCSIKFINYVLVEVANKICSVQKVELLTIVTGEELYRRAKN